MTTPETLSARLRRRLRLSWSSDYLNESDVDDAEALELRLAEAKKVAAEQAEDDGLWFQAQTAPEAYLQQELRRLHATVEGDRLILAALVPDNVSDKPKCACGREGSLDHEDFCDSDSPERKPSTPKPSPPEPLTTAREWPHD